MRLKSLDLIGAGLIALFTMGITILGFLDKPGVGGFPVWFFPFGILMVLFIPGYVLTLAILPELDRATTLLLSLGISISMDIMGGLLLHYTPWGLHPVSWATWLSGISLLGCIIAIYRRSLLSHAPATTRSAASGLSWKAVLSFILTGILLVVAILVARDSAIRAGTPFTQLWAMPALDQDGYAVEVGIRNLELETRQYELIAEARGMTVNIWENIVLAPGETWKTSLPLLEKPQNSFKFLLYRTDTPDEVYRTVDLAPVSFDEFAP